MDRDRKVTFVQVNPVRSDYGTLWFFAADAVFVPGFRNGYDLYMNKQLHTGSPAENGRLKNPSELPACPVETTLMLIGDKWKVLILRDLMEGTMRFGELKKSLGTISQKVLTRQLRSMEEDGLLIRKVYPEVPPRVEYSLTGLGRSLKPILDEMKAWGAGYQKQCLVENES